MQKLFALAIALLAMLSLGGCFGESQTLTVAVVNLDAVADRVGRKESMNAEFKTANEELTAKLQESAEALKATLQASESALRSDPSEANQRAHRQLLLDSTRQLESEKRATTERANVIRKEIIQKFRDEARPVAASVARLRGATLVLTTTETILWAETTIDLTDDVAAAMGEKPKQ